MTERSILAITSKLVAICHGWFVAVDEAEKDELIQTEADYYWPTTQEAYGVQLTIKDHLLIPNAGIDESNADGHFVLWPAEPHRVANELWGYLRQHFKLREVGVVITDSTTTPLRRGTTGRSLAHAGFLALRNYIGQPDLFGRPLKMTQANLADGLAAAAVLAMGEGNEQTPLAVISDLPAVQFQSCEPTEAELQALAISLRDDIYAPLLDRPEWKRGGSSQEPRQNKHQNRAETDEA